MISRVLWGAPWGAAQYNQLSQAKYSYERTYLLLSLSTAQVQQGDLLKFYTSSG